MGQIIVRKLDDSVIAAIKERAKANNRSAEAEVRLALERNYGADRQRRGDALRDLIKMPAAGRTQAEIDDYVAVLRAEWGD